jgi:hypothetical protein
MRSYSLYMIPDSKVLHCKPGEVYENQKCVISTLPVLTSISRNRMRNGVPQGGILASNYTALYMSCIIL